MAAGTKAPVTAGQLAPETQAAVDNATATDSLAPDGAQDPRAPKPTAAPSAGGSRLVFLAASRQNGTFEAPIVDLGEGDSHSVGLTLNVLNVFGGPDDDVRFDGRLYSRRDATEEWSKATTFKGVTAAGVQTASAKLKRQAYFAGSVSGTAGGHAIELELIGDIR